MTYDTINDAVTMRPGGGAVLGRIDKYELVRELGEGGFGAVYLAHDTVADTDVAIKGLPPEVKHNAVELESIRGNFALVKRLRHPNIVAVTDLHQALSVSYASKEVEPKLRVFERDTMVVMDYAPGVTLAKWRRQFPDGKVPLDKAIAVVWQVASALDYAHGQKVLHRDVKPANVMVESADGGKLVARVLDFGLAAEIRSSMGRLSREIRDTSGTRPYMAPEQWKGERQGPATDQYALAAMFYELVVGDVPFASVFDCGDPAVMSVAVTTNAPAIPEDLPKSVRRALAKALAKKPEERFASCGEFVAALEGKKVSRRGAETQRKGKVLGILALLAALAGGGYYGWMKYGKGVESRDAGPERVAVTNQTPPAVVEPPPVVLPPEGPQTTVATNAPAAGEDLTRLAELRKDIFWKKRSVELRKGELEKYREDPDGLSGKIDEADRLCRKISEAAAASTVSETEKIYARLRDDADAFDRTLAWLSDNKALRDEARKLAGGLAALDGDLDRFKAKELAYAPYAKGMASRKVGKSAFDRGDFSEAKERYSAAKKSLEQAVAESRKALVANVLADAKKHLQDEHWEDCIGKCDEALDIDSSNAEAKEMKAQAESNLVPSAKIEILVEGEPLSGVQVKIGEQTWDAPVVWTDRNITAGKTYGGVDVSFERGGKRYVGSLEEFTVDWKGCRDFEVVLKEYKGPKNGATKTITLPGGVTMEMIYVAPGEFTMGSPESEEGHEDDEKQHCVTLTKGFWLGKYEVTQKQWESVMRNNPSNWKGDDLPVENVSWEDCQEFIRKVNASLNCGARLPTEAEWEYACRAGTSGPYAGAGLDSMVWYNSNSGYETHPVGRKSPNAWGFYDMHGNVYEWCNDWYGEYPSGSVTDPIGRASGDCRVLRGGGWDGSARGCRSATRGWYGPGYRYDYFGFRLCCSALP